MDDESPRPASGNWPEQRNVAAPGWWGELERSDLPGDDGSTFPWYATDFIDEPAAARSRNRLPIWIGLALLLVLGAVGALIARTAGPDEAATALILFGIPAVLAAAAVGWLFHRG